MKFLNEDAARLNDPSGWCVILVISDCRMESFFVLIVRLWANVGDIRQETDRLCLLTDVANRKKEAIAPVPIRIEYF